MIAIGCDHAGYELKEQIKKHFESTHISHKDFGTFSDESCDYPVYAKKVADAVANGKSESGILICGSGIGVSIVANKVNGIRAALCYESHLAELARKHNNANILCLGARFTDFEKAIEILDAFLDTKFESGRHQSRIDIITNIELNQR